MTKSPPSEAAPRNASPAADDHMSSEDIEHAADGKPQAILREHLALAEELGRVAMGSSQIQPDKKDRRFAHEVWQNNGYYKRVMQSYLAWRKTMFDILEATDASTDDRERARFAGSSSTTSRWTA